ncbi:MAG: hypothetical protein K2X77_16755, partial [Candidatus Obscuribacterales bacterium]|nr:hypothetical protein [Candidatus Obscuribacterales bacterium]
LKNRQEAALGPKKDEIASSIVPSAHSLTESLYFCIDGIWRIFQVRIVIADLHGKSCGFSGRDVRCPYL